MHRYKTEIGDWSKDGHNQSETVIFDSNLNERELKELYDKMCNTFGHKYCEVVAEEYEDNSVPNSVPDSLVEKMKELNHYNDEWFSDRPQSQEELQKWCDDWNKYCDEHFQGRSKRAIDDYEEENKYTVSSKSYLPLMFNLMQYCNPEFKYKIVGDDDISTCHFDGWGGSGGYGLFN